MVKVTVPSADARALATVFHSPPVFSSSLRAWLVSGVPFLRSVNVPLNTMDCPSRIVALSTVRAMLVPRAGASVGGTTGPRMAGRTTMDCPSWTGSADAAWATPGVASTTLPVAMTLRAASVAAPVRPCGRNPRAAPERSEPWAMLMYTNRVPPARLPDTVARRGLALVHVRRPPRPSRLSRGRSSVHNRLVHTSASAVAALLHSGRTPRVPPEVVRRSCPDPSSLVPCGSCRPGRAGLDVTQATRCTPGGVTEPF